MTWGLTKGSKHAKHTIFFSLNVFFLSNHLSDGIELPTIMKAQNVYLQGGNFCLNRTCCVAGDMAAKGKGDQIRPAAP